jgi:hypothetical protein
VANVGDSRAYLVRDGEVQQITEDHSWVAEQVKLGAMTDQQASNHAYRNVVTRCLGHKPGIQVDIFEHRLRAGDVLLLCSDGLSNQVPMEKISRTLTENAPDKATAKLIDLANRAGGPDNITAVVVQVLALSMAETVSSSDQVNGADRDDKAAESAGSDADVSLTPNGTKPPKPRDLAPPGISPREVAARITPLRGIPIQRLPEKDRVTPQRRRATILLIAIAFVAVAAVVVLIALRAEKLNRQLGWPAPLPSFSLPESGQTLPSAPVEGWVQEGHAAPTPTQIFPP